MDAFTRWVHLLAVAVYLGATPAVALVFLPAMEALEDAALQRRLGGVGRRRVGALTGQRTLRSRSTTWVVAEFMAARLACPSALAANALLALPTPKSENPLAADSLVKLPFATTLPSSRPLPGLTILRSIATDPVRRALVFSNVGLATATPAPVAAAGVLPAIAPAKIGRAHV